MPIISSIAAPEWIPAHCCIVRGGVNYKLQCNGAEVLLLLCGGDKRTQDRDIKRAKDYLHDYKRRTAAQTQRRT